MSNDWITEFVDALHALEERGELEALVSQFAPEASLRNPVRSEPFHGTEQIREFWSTYGHQFERIHSNFDRIIGTDEEAALEWTAKGILRGGQVVSYKGVTLLKRGESGITQFSSYFDPRPFLTELQAASAGTPSHSQVPAASAHLQDELRSAEEIDEEAPSVMSYG